MAMSELNRRRWRNFRRNGRAFWSLVIFAVLFVTAMFAEIVANDKPIVVHIRANCTGPPTTSIPRPRSAAISGPRRSIATRRCNA